MANKGGNPNSEGKGKPTSNVGYSKQFISPVTAAGNSKSWPTMPSDLLGIFNKRPGNPLGIKHAEGVKTSKKDNKY